MPEAGYLPIPMKLAREGVKDMGPHLRRAELQHRLAAWRKSPPQRVIPVRGYAKLFEDSVLQTDQGSDFDFLLREGRTEAKLLEQ
jgi:hypothetical protein